jgi:hypothetical protein
VGGGLHTSGFVGELESDMMPHREEDAVHPKSRHKVGDTGVKATLGGGVIAQWGLGRVEVP